MKNKKKGSRRKSNFWRERRKGYLWNDQRCAEFFGVTLRTIRNWDRKGAPPMAMRLLHLRYGDLSALHSEWRGFRICDSGILWGPNRGRFPAWAMRHGDVVEQITRAEQERDEAAEEARHLRRLVSPEVARQVSGSIIWLPVGMR